MYYSPMMTLGVSHPPPLKKPRPKITKEEGSSENKEQLLDHVFGPSTMKSRCDLLSQISWSGTCLLSG
jgi:hypothetical protein